MEGYICWLYVVFSMENIKNILVSIPVVVLSAFSAYFAYQKIGHKVLTTYSIVFNGSSEKRISDITLINKKNKPITIFSIQAVINKDVVVEVETFKPAIIVKPLESIHIQTTPFSYLRMGENMYDAEYMTPNKVVLFLITEKGKIKCRDIQSPNLSKYFDFKNFKNATKGTMTYNGKVYNDRIKYALVYRYDSKEYTAFIEKSGFIREDWGFKFNMVPKTQMESKEKVKEYLSELGYDKFFQALVVDEIDKR